MDKDVYDNLLNMELHDVLDLDSITSVIRVPGGWIYVIETQNEGPFPHAMTSSFVPYTNE